MLRLVEKGEGTKSTRGSKTKGVKRKGQGTLAGWVVRAPQVEVTVKRICLGEGHRSGENLTGSPGDEGTERWLGLVVHPMQAPPRETWGAGDIGPV